MAQAPCLACTIHDRNCTQDCILAKVIHSNDVLENVASHFGLDNFISLVKAAGPDNFGHVTKSLLLEASQRKVNPVFGAFTELMQLRSRNQELVKENNTLKNWNKLLIENANQRNTDLTSFAKEQNLQHENLKAALAAPQIQEGSTSLKRDHKKAFPEIAEHLMSTEEPAGPPVLTDEQEEEARDIIKDLDI